MPNKGTYKKEYYETHKEQCKQNVKNYQSKLSAITIRLKPTVLEQYKTAAQQSQMSLRAFILEALDEKLKNMS